MSIMAPIRGGIRGVIRGALPYMTGGTPLLLDTLPVQPVAAYSLRKLRAAYTGACIRVRRSSDNAEQDIGFAANLLDTTALTTFCGAGDGFVRTWYTQAGAIDVGQSTAGSQPQIVAAGAVITFGGQPIVQTTGATSLGGADVLGGSPAQLMLCMAHIPDQASGAANVIFRNSVTQINFPGNYGFSANGTGISGGTLPNGTRSVMAAIHSNTLNIQQVWQNNSLVANGAATASVFTDQFSFGFLNGRFNELVVFSAEAAIAQRATVNTNQAAYYP